MNKITVRPKWYTRSPSFSGAAKTLLTLGAASWDDVVEFSCGKCECRSSVKIHERQGWVKCPACGAVNRV